METLVIAKIAITVFSALVFIAIYLGFRAGYKMSNGIESPPSKAKGALTIIIYLVVVGIFWYLA